MVTLGKVMRSTAVVAALVATSAFGAPNVTATKHNLSFSSMNAIKNGVADGGDVCVYCHTPHGSNTAFVGAPIWNKTHIDTATAFTVYGSGAVGVTSGTTIATTPVGLPGDVSTACLSCHDGVSAINSVINAPGSGGYNPTGTGDLRAFLYNTTTTVTAGTVLNMATATSTGISNIGKDLRNDHPIGVAYTVGKAGLVADTSTFSGTTTTIASVLRGGKVECSSCHDPHEANPLFLRTIDNASSKLCTSCHTK